MCPRTKEQNEAIRETRRNQILQAAAEVYIAKGITMEMRDIAAHAGLGYGTVYHYYQNKFQLLDDLLEAAFVQAKAVTDEAVSSRGSITPPELLTKICKLWLRLWLNDHSVYILYKMVAEKFHQVDGERYLPLADRFHNELYIPIANTLNECSSGKYPEKLANLLIGSLIGCAGLHIHHRQNEMDADFLAEALVAGILYKGER